MEIGITQRNWAAGELSPKMRGRSELPTYKGGAERLVNFISETAGPTRFRLGFQYAQNTRRHAKAWLIPFQFNDSDAYEMEFTSSWVRFYRNSGIVTLAAKTISGASVAGGVITVTSTAHGYSNGDEVIINGVVGMTQLNNRSFVVANKSTDAFDLHDSFGSALDGSSYTAYVSGGTASKIYEIASPYAIADVPALKFAQNADVMYFVHHSYAPYKLTRTGNTSWAFATFTRTADPFTTGNWPSAVCFYQGRLYYGGTDLYPESFWGSKPLDASGNPQYDDFTLGTDPADAFKFTLSPITNKVDKIEALIPSLNFLAIATFEGISKANGGVDGAVITPSNIDVTPVVTTGVLQQISPILLGIVMLFVHRSSLVLYSLEFDIFYNAFNAMDKNLVNDHWPQSGLTQMVHFVNRPTGFWFCRNDGVLIWLSYMVKENINAADRIIIGGTDVKVLSVGVMPRTSQYDQLWIVTERLIDGKTCRFVEYQNDEPDIPELDDFCTGDDNAAVDTAAWQNAMFEAQKKYVHVDAALTYDGSEYGSDAGATLTPDAITGKSISFTASAPVFTASMVGRELWKQANSSGEGGGRAVIVSFTSSTVVVCNILTDFDNTTAMAAGAWYLTTASVGGLWHLEGETVSVVTDGGEHPVQEVTNGTISLEYQSSVVHVGLGYSGYMRTMHLDSGSPQVPADGRKINVNRVGVKFQNTLGCRFGTNLYNMKDFQFGASTDLMGRPSPLFSGHLVEAVQDDTAYEKHFYLQQIRPLPCTIEEVTLFTEWDEK